MTAPNPTASRPAKHPTSARVSTARRPSFDDLLTWYASPRRLRTRATGTVFTVRSERGQLVVTPSSGIDRPISRADYRAAQPFLERDAPKHEWQHVSKNTSYLEAIHEETSEELPTLQSFVSSRVRAASEPPPPSAIDWEARYRDQRRQFAEAYRKLQADVAQRDAGIAKRDEAGKILAGQVQQQRRDIAELERLLEAAEQAKVAAQTLLGHARLELKDARDAARMQASAAPHQQQEDEEIAQLKLQLTHANGSRIDAVRQQGEAQARAAAAQREVDDLRKQLKVAQAATTPRSPTGPTVRFEFGGLTLGPARPADPDNARTLELAAKRLVDDPNAAITDCRRVLERCAKRLWQAEHPGRAVSGPFRDLMEDLRDGAIPVSDWHLMKNLWSTASGVVHDGGGTPDLALWVWLGCARVAEMAAQPGTVAR